MTHRFQCSKCERQFEFEAEETELGNLSVSCPVCGEETTERLDCRQPSDGNRTGTYKFSRSLGRLVKISDRIPGVAAGGAGCSSCQGGTCSTCSPACR